jgi:acetylornithine deacetylase/succinyl-diaminopimelate desuccinylase-like protein
MLKARGRLPVNLILIAEGEEEMGSRNLGPFLRTRREVLSRADGVFMPLPAVDDKGVAKLFFGVKGICYFELECSGALWGRGPTLFDIHSSSKAIVDSPAWRLVNALSSMVSEDGNRSVIQGFYDDVTGPNHVDRDLIDRLNGRFTPDQMQIEISGVDRWINDIGDIGVLLERYLCQPTLNIDGVWGGYTREGTKTVLPHRMTCKIDIRLVPNMDPERTMQRVRDHLDAHGFSDIAIRPLQLVHWAKADPESDVARALIATMEHGGREVLVFPNAPGTGPWHLFTKDPLALPCAIGGLGHGGRAHSPDEYFVIRGKDGVSDYRDCERSYVDFLYSYAEEVAG